MSAERDLTAAGVRFRYYPTAADGAPPLVVMHGLFGSSDNWQTQARRWCAARPVLVADMPNHGASLHTDIVDYRDLVPLMWRAVDGALGELRADGDLRGSETPGAQGTPVDLLGHSMGGKAAMAMALESTERVRRLVVVDIAPRVYPPRHDAVFAAMEAVITAGPRSRAEAERAMQPHLPDRAVRLFLLKSLAPDDEGFFRWILNFETLREGYGALSDWPYTPRRTKPFAGPTLFIIGGRSPYVGSADRETARAWFPHAEFSEIAEAGHWLHAEARERFVSMVDERLT